MLPRALCQGLPQKHRQGLNLPEPQTGLREEQEGLGDSRLVGPADPGPQVCLVLTKGAMTTQPSTPSLMAARIYGGKALIYPRAGVLMRTLWRGLGNTSQPNKQIHHKVTSEPQGPTSQL